MLPAPTSLDPSDGTYLGVDAPHVFSWVTNEVQGMYYIEWQENKVGAQVYSTGWIVSTKSEHLFPANSFSPNTEYKWRVKIKDSYGEESAFSIYATFWTKLGASVRIVYPTEGLLITTPPLYEHYFDDPSNIGQLKAYYELWHGAIFDDIDALTAEQQESYTWDQLETLGGGLAWDGWIYGSGNKIQQPWGYYVPGVTWYKVRVSVWDMQLNFFISDFVTHQVILDDTPPIPEIYLKSDSANGVILIFINNPTPGPAEVPVAYNKVYRRRANTESDWILIQNNVIEIDPATGLVLARDAQFRSGSLYEYKVSAVGTNGVEGPTSSVILGVCYLEGYWITDPDTNETFQIILNGVLGDLYVEEDREEKWGLDQKYPVVTYGSKRCWRGSIQGVIAPEEGSSETLPEIIDKFRALVYKTPKKPLLLRSFSGDVWKVDIYNVRVSPFGNRDDIARMISFEWVEVADPPVVS